MKAILKKGALCLLAAAALGILAGCASKPSAQGMTREQITEKFKNKEISRQVYIDLITDYERLHPQEGAANPNNPTAATQQQNRQAAPAFTPESSRERDAPVYPSGVDAYVPPAP